MKKSLMCKALLMILLIVTLPLCIPVALADTSVPPANEQCYEKAKKGESFVDFMDNGIIKAIESIAALMYGISTLINTIDYFITLTTNIIGQIRGDQPSCCTSIVGAIGPCKVKAAEFEIWTQIKNNPILQGIIAFTTCACCSNGAEPGMQALAGGGIGICPLGNIIDKLTPGLGEPDAKGIGKFHLSAFENIYVAAGCLCPIAILFNLRKLKTLYQTHNCCVEEACKNDQSTEGCERQLDEALCMYWEGSAIKALIGVIASILVGFLAQYIQKWFEESLIIRCILMVLELSRIPARAQALLGAFSWFQQAISEPDCSQLSFEKAKKPLESGYWSQTAGMRYNAMDTNDDGIGDTAYREPVYSSTDTGVTVVTAQVSTPSGPKSTLGSTPAQQSASSSKNNAGSSGVQSVT